MHGLQIGARLQFAGVSLLAIELGEHPKHEVVVPYQPSARGPGKAEFDTHATVHESSYRSVDQAESTLALTALGRPFSTRDTRKANQAADLAGKELLGIRLGQRLGRHAVQPVFEGQARRQQPTRQLQTETRMAGWGFHAQVSTKSAPAIPITDISKARK